MTFVEILKTVNKREIELQKVKTSLERNLKDTPEGSMYTLNVGGYSRYYKKISGKKSLTYLSKDKAEEIKLYERKNYYQKLLDSVNSELKLYESFLKNTDNLSEMESVFLNIPEEQRHLIEPYNFVNNEKDVKKFLSFRDYSHVSRSSLKTLNGEKVRSKSEVIIADRLKSYGIPYLYEPLIHMGEEDIECLPDFYAMNKRTGETFLWEHFGMLHDKEYCDNMHSKLEKYAECGIYVGKNLIITSETTTHQLNTDYVDRLIKQYLL